MMLRYLFPITLFLSAFLLFSIQPLVAKSLLPYFGGSSGVWTINSLFFSGLLLFGYAYATFLSWLKKVNRWRTVHITLILLSLISIPVVFKIKVHDLSPQWMIIKNLSLQLGLPLLVLGATAPLLQFAYSQTVQKDAKDPYFLYSASNMGSLIALISYPFIIEQFLQLKNQYIYWSIAYIIFVVLLCMIFYFNQFTQEKNNQQLEIETHQAFKWYHPFYWIFLSFVPCSLMLGVTTFITTDIASIPLFWVIPLSLYLLTYILIFRHQPIISYSFLAKNAIYLLVIPWLSMIIPVHYFPITIELFFHLLNFFILSLLCHQKLYHHRPDHSQLTLFYLSLSLGGFLAGIFNGIFAPQFFNYNYEYYIAMLIALFTLPRIVKKSENWVSYMIMVFLLLSIHYKELTFEQISFAFMLFAILLLQKKKPSLILSFLILSIFGLKTYLLKNNEVLSIQRNFYGIKKIMTEKNLHVLINESTIHGFQNMRLEHPEGTESYYGVVYPLITAMKATLHPMTTTLIGLGTGSMVCQFNPDNILNIVEIDKQVIDIAQNPQWFTYLKKCPNQIHIHEMDGRLYMQSQADHSQDLIIIDAFSSDAIPTHLLTLEAFQLYQKKLKKNGGLLIHISNRHLNLTPVIKANAYVLKDMLFKIEGQDNEKTNEFGSTWLFLTKNSQWAEKFQNMKFDTSTQPLLWTDNYSNIVPILN